MLNCQSQENHQQLLFEWVFDVVVLLQQTIARIRLINSKEQDFFFPSTEQVAQQSASLKGLSTFHVLIKLMNFRVYQYFGGSDLVSLCFSFLEVNCALIKLWDFLNLTTS